MELSSTALLLALMVMYMILGCFLDGISMIVLTLAVVEPLVRMAGIDLIWFGVFVVLVGEMALITPPIGFNLFLVQGMTGRDIGFISRAAAPMFALMFIARRFVDFIPRDRTLAARSSDCEELMT